jgi:hypothetical protein
VRRQLPVVLLLIAGLASTALLTACSSGSTADNSLTSETADAAATDPATPDRSAEATQFLAATCPDISAVATFNEAWTGDTTTLDEIHAVAIVARDASADASVGLSDSAASWGDDVIDDLAVLRADYEAAGAEYEAIAASDSIEFLNGFAFRDNSTALEAFSRVAVNLGIESGDCG